MHFNASTFPNIFLCVCVFKHIFSINLQINIDKYNVGIFRVCGISNKNWSYIFRDAGALWVRKYTDVYSEMIEYIVQSVNIHIIFQPYYVLMHPIGKVGGPQILSLQPPDKSGSNCLGLKLSKIFIPFHYM